MNKNINYVISKIHMYQYIDKKLIFFINNQVSWIQIAYVAYNCMHIFFKFSKGFQNVLTGHILSYIDFFLREI